MANAELSSTRWHELALQRWFYQRFFVEEGYPIPLIWSSPMDAFSHFEQLWAQPDHPFKYLLDAKDSNGTPLYLPHPAKPVYPLISVQRKGWSFRSNQNYSIHKWRRGAWVTNNKDVKKRDMAYVQVTRMPMAWDFKFQVDFMSLRPDTQAIFLHRLMNEFWRSGGGPQTWLEVSFPPIWGPKFVRMKMDGDIENMTPEEPGEGLITIFRSSFNLTVEGYVPDIDAKYLPAFWQLELNSTVPSDPERLEALFNHVWDFRDVETNPILDERTNLPPVQ